MGIRLSRPPIGKFWIERCVCAPQSDFGGMDSEPKESDSMRDGSEAMALASSEDDDDDASGRIEERTPGVNVAGANTCFIFMGAFGLCLVEQHHLAIRRN